MTDAKTRSDRLERRGNDGWVFPDLVVEVAGDLACFTRPELKVERVSYPVMTPSAARGVLEAIFWKPEFQYIVRRIEVLRPIEWLQVRRNEVTSVITEADVRALRADPRKRYDVEDHRDQRNMVALRDVAYRLHAQVRPHRPTAGAEQKYREQLRRRVDRGACFAQPFLGCREFTADFGPPTSQAAPIQRTEELGVMLHSIAYTGRGEEYRWFRARLQDGVLEVPQQPLPDQAVSMPSAPWRTDEPGR